MAKQVKLFCLLCMCCVFFLCSGVAFAQTSVFDKFEAVRVHEGPAMLGAAERAVYNMDTKEGSVFALMLEDELKRRWADVNKPFLDFDLQQIMRKAFGNEFDAGKLDQIVDYNTGRIIREVLDSGYVIEDRREHFYPWIDYAYLIRAFAGKTSEEVKAYFELCLADSQDVTQSGLELGAALDQKAAVIYAAETYLKNYPLAYRKAAVADLYKSKLLSYFSPAEAMQSSSMDEDTVKSYRRTAEKYPGSKLGEIAGRLAEAWTQQNYQLDETMINFIAQINEEIALLADERVRGIYWNNKGLDLFKPQGQKDYLLLSGQVTPVYKAQQQFSDVSNFVVLDLRGVTEKTIPVDVNNVPYPATFTAQHVLGAGAWAIDSDLFRADFVAFGRSPAWSLRLLTDDEVIFESASLSQPLSFKYQAPVVENKNGRESYQYTLQNTPASVLTVTIVQQPARDNLAGVDYAYTATVTVNGRKYEGVAFKQGAFPGNPDMIKAAE